MEENYASEVNSFSDFKPTKKSAKASNNYATEVNSLSGFQHSSSMYKKVQDASLASIKIVGSTALNSVKLMKNTMGDIARGINDDLRTNKQNVKTQTFSAISPFVGYLINKFTETEAYANMVESIKSKASDMWESFKEKGRSLFSRKQETYGTSLTGGVYGEDEEGIPETIKKKRKKKKKKAEGTISATEFGDVLLSIDEGVSEIRQKVKKKSARKKLQSAVVSDDVPKLAKGGHVKKEGLAYIHEGEDVIPKGKLKKRSKRILANYQGIGKGAISTLNDFFVGKEMQESPILSLEEKQVSLLGDVANGVDMLRVEMVGETKRELESYKDREAGLTKFLDTDTGKVLKFTAKSIAVVTGSLAALTTTGVALSSSMYMISTNLGNIAGFMVYDFLPVAKVATTALSSIGMLGPALAGLTALSGLIGAVGLFKIGKVLFKKRGGFSSDLPKSSPNIFANIEGILRTQYVGFMSMFENMVAHLRLISKTNADVASSVTGNNYKSPEENKTRQYSYGGNFIKKVARVMAGKDKFSFKDRVQQAKDYVIDKYAAKLGLGSAGLDNLGLTEQEIAKKKANSLVSERATPAGLGGFGGTSTLMTVLTSIRDALTGNTGSVLGKARIGVAASVWNTWELLRQVKRENDLCIKSPCTKKKEKKQEQEIKKDKKSNLNGTILQIKATTKTQKLLNRMGDSLDGLGMWFKKKFPKTSELLSWIWTGITSLFGMVKDLFKPIIDLFSSFGGGGLGMLGNGLDIITSFLKNPVVLGAIAAAVIGYMAGKWIQNYLNERQDKTNKVGVIKANNINEGYKSWQTTANDFSEATSEVDRAKAREKLDVFSTARSTMKKNQSNYGQNGESAESSLLIQQIDAARMDYMQKHMGEYTQFSPNVLKNARDEFDSSKGKSYWGLFSGSPDQFGQEQEQGFLKFLNDKYKNLKGNKEAKINEYKEVTLGSVASDIWESEKAGISAIGDFFKDIGKSISEKWTEWVVNPVSTFISDMDKWGTEHIVDPINNLVSSIGSFFTGVSDTFGKIGSGLSESWATFREKAIDPITDKIHEVFDSLFGWFTELYDKFANSAVGKMFIDSPEEKAKKEAKRKNVEEAQARGQVQADQLEEDIKKYDDRSWFTKVKSSEHETKLYIEQQKEKERLGANFNKNIPLQQPTDTPQSIVSQLQASGETPPPPKQTMAQELSAGGETPPPKVKSAFEMALPPVPNEKVSDVTSTLPKELPKIPTSEAISIIPQPEKISSLTSDVTKNTPYIPPAAISADTTIAQAPIISKSIAQGQAPVNNPNSQITFNNPGAPSMGEYNQVTGTGQLGPSNTGLTLAANRAGKGFDNLITKWAAKFGVNPNYVKSMLKQESDGNPNAVSYKGATGLMQLMPDTAADLGVTNLKDPDQNIMGGVKYIKEQLNSFKDPALALAAYNAGPASVIKGIQLSGTTETGPVLAAMADRSIQSPEHHKQTIDYVTRISRNFKDYTGETMSPGWEKAKSKLLSAKEYAKETAPGVLANINYEAGQAGQAITSGASSLYGAAKTGANTAIEAAPGVLSSARSGVNSMIAGAPGMYESVKTGVSGGVTDFQNFLKDSYESGLGSETVARMKASGTYDKMRSVADSIQSNPAVQSGVNKTKELTGQVVAGVKDIYNNPGVQAGISETGYQFDNIKKSAGETYDSIIASLPEKTQQTADAIYLSGNSIATSLGEVSKAIQNNPGVQSFIAESQYQGGKIKDKTNTYGVELKDRMVDAKVDAEVYASKQQERLIKAHGEMSEKFKEVQEGSNATVNNMVLSINNLVKTNNSSSKNSNVAGGGGNQAGAHDDLLSQILSGNLT